MKLSTVLTQIVFAAALPVAVMAAPACGSKVSGKVVLDADMTCFGTNGLIVDADNTTIDLNGHTISCTGVGYKGSCQGSFVRTGVNGSLHKNVLIKGPGKVDGFTYGVYAENSAGVTIRDLEVTGPPAEPIGNNPRPFSVGVGLSYFYCVQNTSPQANVVNNTITNVTTGIRVYQAECIKASHNYIHDLSSDASATFGIDLNSTGGIALDANRVESVGTNQFSNEAAINVRQDSQLIQITNNAVSGNCATGLSLLDTVHDNVVKGNVFRNNGTTAASGKCVPPAAGVFYDMAIRDAVTNLGNTFTKNNLCGTQFGPIPAGVCNAGE